jgi:hypothetical protein
MPERDVERFGQRPAAERQQVVGRDQVVQLFLVRELAQDAAQLAAFATCRWYCIER